MKVKELLALLNTLDPEDHVVMDACDGVTSVMATIEDVVVLDRLESRFLIRSTDLTTSVRSLPHQKAIVLFKDS